MSTGSFFKALLGPLNKVANWITADDEKLQRARARAMEAGEAVIEGDVKNKAKDNKNAAGAVDEGEKEEVERFVDEFSVWEEIDSYRTTFWFGSKMGKYLSRSRTRDKKLKQELDELERKREEERMKGEGN